MPLPIARNIRVHALDPDVLTVEWSLEVQGADLADFVVEVWRGESEGGPYALVSPQMNAADVFLFQDREPNLYSKWRFFYYQVRVISIATPSEYAIYGSVPHRQVLEGAFPRGVTVEAPPDKFALESIRRFNLVLREHAGRRVLALVSRTFGPRCTECWDALKRRQTKSGCMTCYDQGVTGGFFHAMESWLMKPPHSVMNQLTPLFEMQADDRIFWASKYPRLKPRDLIISAEGDRFRVIKINRAEKAWALTRQTLQARRLSRDQVEYQIPISQGDWGRTALTAGAVREHIRAMNVDAYRAATQRLGVATEELFPETSELAAQTEGSNASSE